MAVRFGTPAAAIWLESLTGGTINEEIAPWLAGATLAIGSVVIVGMNGRLIQSGVKLAGLSWLDRCGGAILGGAEGLLVAMLILLGTTLVLGREHPVIQTSRSVALYDAARVHLGEKLDDMAISAPEKWF